MATNPEQDGFSEAPLKPIAGAPGIPVADAVPAAADRGPRPDPRAAMPAGGLGALRPELTEFKTNFVPHRPERPEKSEGGVSIELVSEFSPAGDQPEAIARLSRGIAEGKKQQTLLGVTGSGKTAK